MGFWTTTKKSKEDKSEGEAPMSDGTTVDLGEVLDISFAAKIHAQLKDEVENKSAVNFISSELTRVDASCLQVLASFMGYAKENNIAVHWDAPNDVLKDAARLTGLSEILELSNV